MANEKRRWQVKRYILQKVARAYDEAARAYASSPDAGAGARARLDAAELALDDAAIDYAAAAVARKER